MEKIGEDAQPAAPKLYELLQSDLNGDVRANAAIGLISIAKRDAVLINQLNRALRDPAFFVRRSAAQSLGRLGSDAKVAIPNRIIHDNKLEDRVLHQDAERIAWECLKQSYLPTSANRDAVLAALGGEDATRRLDYLEHCLHLIQTINPAEDQIRFALDPLAEYLAGLCLVNQYGSNQKAWHQLLDDLHQIPETPTAVAGFLMAVRDCCIAKGAEAHIPDFVTLELAELADAIA